MEQEGQPGCERLALLKLTVDKVGADIDHDGSLLEPRALNKLRLTDSSDDNVGLLDLIEVQGSQRWNQKMVGAELTIASRI